MSSKVIRQGVKHTIKVVLGGSPRCPDNHDLSKWHCLYDLGNLKVVPWQCIITDIFINCLQLTFGINLLNISQNYFPLINIGINFERCLRNHGRNSNALWDSIHNRSQSRKSKVVHIFMDSDMWSVGHHIKLRWRQIFIWRLVTQDRLRNN